MLRVIIGCVVMFVSFLAQAEDCPHFQSTIYVCRDVENLESPFYLYLNRQATDYSESSLNPSNYHITVQRDGGVEESFLTNDSNASCSKLNGRSILETFRFLDLNALETFKYSYDESADSIDYQVTRDIPGGNAQLSKAYQCSAVHLELPIDPAFLELLSEGDELFLNDGTSQPGLLKLEPLTTAENEVLYASPENFKVESPAASSGKIKEESEEEEFKEEKFKEEDELTSEGSQLGRPKRKRALAPEAISHHRNKEKQRRAVLRAKFDELSAMVVGPNIKYSYMTVLRRAIDAIEEQQKQIRQLSQ